MDKIYREIWVAENYNVPDIHVVQNSIIPIELRVMDRTIPDKTPVAAYATGIRSEDTYVCSNCSITGNLITIRPNAGFFVPGHNLFQVKVSIPNAPALSFVLTTYCDPDLSGGKPPATPQAVTSLVGRAEAAAKQAVDAAKKVPYDTMYALEKKEDIYGYMRPLEIELKTGAIRYDGHQNGTSWRRYAEVTDVAGALISVTGSSWALDDKKLFPMIIFCNADGDIIWYDNRESKTVSTKMYAIPSDVSKIIVNGDKNLAVSVKVPMDLWETVAKKKDCYYLSDYPDGDLQSKFDTIKALCAKAPKDIVIDENIHLTDGERINISGLNGVTIDFSGCRIYKDSHVGTVGDYAETFYFSGCKNITVSGGYFYSTANQRPYIYYKDGNNQYDKGQGSNATAMHFHECTNAVVTDVHTDYLTGIRFTSSSGMIDRCRIDNCENGIYVGKCVGVVIKDTYLRLNNTTLREYYHPFYIKDSCDEILINNCVVDGYEGADTEDVFHFFDSVLSAQDSGSIAVTNCSVSGEFRKIFNLRKFRDVSVQNISVTNKQSESYYPFTDIKENVGAFSLVNSKIDVAKNTEFVRFNGNTPTVKLVNDTIKIGKQDTTSLFVSAYAASLSVDGCTFDIGKYGNESISGRWVFNFYGFLSINKSYFYTSDSKLFFAKLYAANTAYIVGNLFRNPSLASGYVITASDYSKMISANNLFAVHANRKAYPDGTTSYNDILIS